MVGFDGVLRISADGRAWQDVAVSAAPYSLAAAPAGQSVVATTESGPLRSVDGGRSWAPLPDAPLLGLVDWADGDTVVGVTADGSIFVSTDAGLTWQQRGSVQARSQAVGAVTDDGGSPRVLVAIGDAVLESTDGGASFSKLFPR